MGVVGKTVRRKAASSRRSPHEFARFKRECERWIRILGLTDWRVVYVWTDADGENGFCKTSMRGRVATIGLGRRHERPVREIAKHEVMELLLAPLVGLANCRWVQADEVEEATHAVIRRLEGLKL